MPTQKIKEGFDKQAVKRVAVSEVLHWLKSGIKDFTMCPGIAVFYGFLFWAVSLAIWLFLDSQPALRDASVPLLAVVILVLGPVSAMSLYSVSKKLGQGEHVSLKTVYKAIGSDSKTSGSYPSIFLSLLLVILAAAWMMFSPLIYALFSSGSLQITNQSHSLSQAIMHDITSGDNMTFTLAYAVFSGIFAWVAFMISWFSFPMVLDKDIDSLTAAIHSFRVSITNKSLMLLWILIVSTLVLIALLTPYFIGLIIIIPLLAHATWHAYIGMIGKVEEKT